jgi:hypothetical protein
MQKKTTTKIVLLVVSILAVSSFFACLEEPFIEPSKIPFTVLRIGNLTENVNELAISIDGEFPVPALQNLQKDTFTEYFELVAGRRYFVIMDPATGDTLFEKFIETLSYEEQTMWYAGYWSPSIDTSTANFFIHSDAITYLSKDPPQDDLNLIFLHSSPDTPTDSTRAFDITAYSIDGTDTTEVEDNPVVSGILFGEVAGYVLAEGEYKFDVTRELNDGTEVIVSTYTGSFSQGMWSWMYLVGEASSLRIVREDKEPLPARPKL